MKEHKWIFMLLKLGYFHYHPIKDAGIKILTPKQMLQQLPIALAQAKTKICKRKSVKS